MQRFISAAFAWLLPLRPLRETFVGMILLLSLPASAQDYPVQTTTILTPPYSRYLADYASADRNAFQLIVQLKELDRPEYKVKLRLTIEGQGIRLQTSPRFNPQPTILQGGVPEMLTGADISSYFNPNNMDFSGITPQQFMKSGALPEGFYTFKVEVLDYFRNVVVSNAGIANAWLILNDPPLINLPFNDEKVQAADPQNIMFSWTPRHTGSPNAAFTTEYEFTLVELYPANRNPNDAIRAANPIYVSQTTSTSLNYGIAEPLLIPGRRYAFRIKAYDTEGRDLFKNNGYSEVYVFQFGDACLTPSSVEAEALDPARIKLTWDAQEVHTSFGIQYRKAGGEWMEEDTYSTSLIIPGLEANSTYEYQIKGNCGTISGNYSTLASITTPETAVDEFSCGSDIPTFEIKTTPLLKPLQTGDLIQTADFEITISELTANSDGSYSGEGFAFLPWLKFASVRVKFNSIRVNEEYRVYNGIVTTIYSRDSRFVASLDLAGDKMKEGEKESDSPIDPKKDFDGVDVSVDGDIADVEVDSNGDIVVTKDDGTTEVIHREKDKDGNYEDTRLTDSDGDTWIVDKDGDVSEGPSSAPPDAITSRDSINFIVQFDLHSDQQFGFDKKEYGPMPYDNIRIRDQDYVVAWKSVETGRQDVLLVSTVESKFPEIVGLKTLSGEASSQAGSQANEKQVFVTGMSPGSEETLTAYVAVLEPGKEKEEIEVGRLNITAYNKIRKTLVIVPVNDVQAPEAASLQEEINRIYGQAVVEWDITIAERFDYEVEDLLGLDNEESDWISSYPDKMKKLNRTYRNSTFIDNNACYVFLIGGKDVSARTGFMPFKRKYGYIFTDNLGGGSLTTAIAHELGHGAFRLRHTFSSENFVAEQGSTDNLMDYNNGTMLKKYQWDLVHDPENMNGWLEDDEESAMSWPCFGWLDDCDDILGMLNVIKAKVAANANLVLFKPDESKKRKKEYIGYNLGVGDTDYNEIRMLNEIEKDDVIDPNIYYDFVSKLDNNKFEKGFMFKVDENSNFKILVTDEEDSVATFNKAEKLRYYLFGNLRPSGEQSGDSSPFEIQLFEGGNRTEEGSTLLISAEPSMPDIRVKIAAPDVQGDFKVKLVVEYLRPCDPPGVARSPNQSESFPSNGWREIEQGEEWDIDFGVDTETNRPKIRGGRAYLIVESPAAQVDTLKFFIKGTNPTVAQVNDFVNQAPYNQVWFFKRIIFHESGTPNNLNADALQFNNFNQNQENLGANWNAFSRCPNFGSPCGWGLMQLDNPSPPVQALWDWKANIITAYDLIQDKRSMVISNLNAAWDIISRSSNPDAIVVVDENTDGGITYTHSSSGQFTHQINAHFGDVENEPNHSLIEACWIKTYNGLAIENGVARHYYYLTEGDEFRGVPIEWHICDYAIWRDRQGTIHYNYYVREISEQDTPN